MHNYSEFPPQFIVWRSVAGLPGVKPRKTPWDAHKGEAIDHLNPANWMPYDAAVEVARRAGPDYGPAFVVTENDPYFLLDLDNCRDANTGETAAWALAVGNLFPGAWMEPSTSGTGWHIMGRVDPARVADLKSKFDPAGHPTPGKKDGEFYHWGRFVALGQGNVGGSLNVDWTNSVLQLPIPRKSEEAGEVETFQQPEADYTGPADDNDLIARMLDSSDKQQALADGGFTNGNGGAKFRDLWEANAQALARVFPAVNVKGRVTWDGSAADLALMNHLAFWTGRDLPRMERLFRLSGLEQYRADRGKDDHSHKNYLRAFTGLRACQGTSKWLGQGSKDSQEEKNARAIERGELIARNEYPALFAGIVWVAERKAFLMPNGSFYDKEQLDAHFGGYSFMLKQETKPSQRASEGFLMNAICPMPKVTRVGFDPARAFLEQWHENGHTYVNSYLQPHYVAPAAGDITPFLEILAINFPDPNDREILLSWMAAVVQRPGQIIGWAPVLQGAKGCGKSLIWEAVLTHCLGTDYVSTPSFRDLSANFNGYIFRKTLVAVDEMNKSDKRADIAETAEYLKPYITNRRVPLREMRMDSRTIDNTANWIFTTNHKEAMFATPGERRYAHFISAMQTAEDLQAAGLTEGKFAAFFEWFYGAGREFLRHYLMTRPSAVPRRAPHTTSTREAVTEGMSDIAATIFEFAQDGSPGLRNGWINATVAGNLLEGRGLKRPGPRLMSKIMESLGYVRHNAGRVTLADGSKATLYCIPSLANAPEPRALYEAGQQGALGYAA